MLLWASARGTRGTDWTCCHPYSTPSLQRGTYKGFMKDFQEGLSTALSLDPGSHWFCLCRACPGSGMLMCSPAPLESCPELQE